MSLLVKGFNMAIIESVIKLEFKKWVATTFPGNPSCKKDKQGNKLQVIK
jgi:hypothetical protein